MGSNVLPIYFPENTSVHYAWTLGLGYNKGMRNHRLPRGRRVNKPISIERLQVKLTTLYVRGTDIYDGDGNRVSVLQAQELVACGLALIRDVRVWNLL